MATYEYLGGTDEIQVLSDDFTRPAQRISAQSAKSQIVFSLLFAPWPTDPQGNVIWGPDAIAQQLAYWSGIWDTNAAVPGVLGISVTQGINPAGQLKDVAIVTVASTSGKSTTTYELFDPIDFLPDGFAHNVGTYRGILDEVEAASG